MPFKSSYMNFRTCAFPPRINFKKGAYIHSLICCFISSDWYTGIRYLAYFLVFPVEEAANGMYQSPPEEIRAIVDASPTPSLSFSPDKDQVLFLQRRALPPLSYLARPELKLAGMRIDPEYNTRSRMWVFCCLFSSYSFIQPFCTSVFKHSSQYSQVLIITADLSLWPSYHTGHFLQGSPSTSCLRTIL